MLNLLEQKTYKTLKRTSNSQHSLGEDEQDHLTTDEPYQESNPRFQHQAACQLNEEGVVHQAQGSHDTPNHHQQLLKPVSRANLSFDPKKYAYIHF